MQVALAVAPQYHIGCGNGEHIGLQFQPEELVTADMALPFLVRFLRKHLVHSGNQETRRTTTRVEDFVGRLEFCQFTE